MLAFICPTLLLLLLLPAAATGEGENPKFTCEDKICISLPNTTLTAEAGLCVFVPCFLNGTNKVQSITWFKCDKECKQAIWSSKKQDVNSKFKGRVLPLIKHPNKKNCSITINNVTEDDTGSYQVNFSLNKDPKSLTAKVNISVTALTQKPSLNVSRLVVGQSATLTCTAPSHGCQTPPDITWTWRNGTEDVPIPGSVTKPKTEKQTNVSTLTFNVSAEHDNTEVTCEVRFSNGVAITAARNLSLHTSPRISDSSKCTRRSDVLTCVCVSEGSPRPTIEWPHLVNRSRYSLLTTVSDHKVNSTVTVSGGALSSSNVQCVSGNVSKDLVVDVFQEKDVVTEFLRSFRQLQVLVAFLVGLLLGIILTSLITCLARTCRRKKSHSLTDDLQMMDAGRSAEGERTDAGGDERVTEVEYSDINFSALKAKDAAGAEAAPAAETEYAEIKKEAAEAGGAGEEEEAALGGSEGRSAVAGGEEGTRASAEEEGGEEVALYSNVNEIMVEI